MKNGHESIVKPSVIAGGMTSSNRETLSKENRRETNKYMINWERRMISIQRGLYDMKYQNKLLVEADYKRQPRRKIKQIKRSK